MLRGSINLSWIISLGLRPCWRPLLRHIEQGADSERLRRELERLIDSTALATIIYDIQMALKGSTFLSQPSLSIIGLPRLEAV